MSIPLYERALALVILIGLLCLPWLYVGTGLYIFLERPGLTTFTSLMLGHLLTMFVGLGAWLAWDKVISRADVDS